MYVSLESRESLNDEFMEGLRLVYEPELKRGGRPWRKLALCSWENAGGRNGA